MITQKSVSQVADAVQKLVPILNTLTAEGRQKAIASAMAIFGEADLPSQAPSQKNEATSSQETPGGNDGISPKATGWMRKNSITREQLEHVFSIDDTSIETIAAKMPGNTQAKQTVEAYILCGVASYLSTGAYIFTDKDARALCERVGAFNRGNHLYNTKKFGSFISGSKETGWKITNPGLTEGVRLIKKLLPVAVD
jgi:hypothetical protein